MITSMAMQQQQQQQQQQLQQLKHALLYFFFPLTLPSSSLFGQLLFWFCVAYRIREYHSTLFISFMCDNCKCQVGRNADQWDYYVCHSDGKFSI